jgi:eukaryotic-like serine/threonine-protein kinase
MPSMLGQRIGRFQVESLYAEGGMGEIYLARNPSDGREALIKLPSPALLADAAAQERFKREVAALRALDHPGIERLIESGSHGSRPYLALERTRGVTLREALRRRGALPVGEAVEIARQLAGALAHAHAHGVVHRDLKPENVVVAADHPPVIVDFGAALLEGARRLTFSGLTGELGTPEYMAPEQARGERGDGRSDVYALGTLLYELLLGRTPFAARPGDGAVQVLRRHLEDEPPEPALVGLDPALAGVLRRALRRDPEQRFASMTAFAEALADPTGAVARGDVTAGWTPDAGGRPAGRARPGREHLLYAALTLVALLGLVGLGWLASVLRGGGAG